MMSQSRGPWRRHNGTRSDSESDYDVRLGLGMRNSLLFVVMTDVDTSPQKKDTSNLDDRVDNVDTEREREKPKLPYCRPTHTKKTPLL